MSRLLELSCSGFFEEELNDYKKNLKQLSTVKRKKLSIVEQLNKVINYRFSKNMYFKNLIKKFALK